MKTFKRILFPVDFSQSSSKVVPYVRAMAKTFDSEIHLLFVGRAFEYYAAIYVPNVSIKTLEREIMEGAERRLEEFKFQYFRKFANVQTVVVQGDISEEILKYIDSKKIDLLIMGTHGRKGFEKIVLGSVADRVAKASPVPILLINPYKTS